MSYNAQEESEQGGYPTELYEFSDGVEVLRYTTADEEIVDISPPATWQQAALRRGEPQSTAALDAATLEVKAPRDFPLAVRFRIVPPPATWFLTIFRYHRSDTPTPERRVFWGGLLRSVSWANSFSTLHLQNENALLKNEGLRLQYQRSCNFFHYGLGCELNPTPHTFSGTVDSVSGSTVVASFMGSILPPSLLTGTAVSPDGERRMITLHSGSTIEILQPFQTLAAGDTLEVRRGCDRNQAACNTYSNTANYGGIPTIPLNNPFQHGIEA